MVSNTLEEIFKASSVFKDKSKLSPDYIPANLPHRENKIREIGLAFREVILNPGKISARVVIAGRTGTGKTAVAKVFGLKFTEIAKSRGIRVEYIHLNCHRDRTLYLLISEAAIQLKLPIPFRGLSSHEILKAIHEYLERRNSYLIMTLDEFDYFLDAAPADDIYFLVRIYDELPSLIPRINYIFIVRDLSKIRTLDPIVRDHIARQIIEFPPYNSNELYDILQDRVQLAFNENTVLEDVLRYIADTHGYDKGGTGNARVAIET
ncbi:MAG: ORC1-type DNA replication protein, partial [Sulfolobales archaeon]